MVEVNQFGLSRAIPADVKREVRQRCKFGCVLCRSGFYQYEHIEPTFGEARTHDPSGICCLCGSCHDRVTRMQLSKAAVKDAYQKIHRLGPEAVERPRGPLDFHDGSAELTIGRLLYKPAVRTVVRYHGQDVMRVVPGSSEGELGAISAVFTNDRGERTLRLHENEFIGSLENWDVEVTGTVITVRRMPQHIVLRLKLDPPGRIIIDRLDMRIGDSHLLVGSDTYAVGRYLADGQVFWAHAHMGINKCSPYGAAIELLDRAELDARDARLGGHGPRMEAAGGEVVLDANVGVFVRSLGIVFASLCGGFALAEFALGTRPLDEMQRVILSNPDKMCQYVATGDVE